MIIKIICIIALIACLIIAYYSWTIHIHKPLEDEGCKGSYCPVPGEWRDPEKRVEKIEEWKEQMK